MRAPWLPRLALVLLALAAPAVLFAEAEEEDRALQNKIDAVKAEPNDPRNHYNLGVTLYNRGSTEAPASPQQAAFYDKATKALTQALKVNKRDKEAHGEVDLNCLQILGTISMELKEYGDAVDWYQQGIDLDGKDPLCLFGKGQAFYFDKKFSDAKEAFDTYLSATKGNPAAREQASQALTYLGAMGMEQRKYAEAAEYFRRVISEFPKQSKEASRNLSLVLLAQGDELRKKRKVEEAVALYDQAVAADRKHEDAIMAAALAHFELGEPLVRSKDDAIKSQGRSHLKIAEGHFKSAAKSEKYAADYRVWFQLGVCQFHLEKFDDMIESYTRSVGLDPNQADARYNLALALHRKGVFEEALKEAEQARRLNKDDKTLVGLVGKIYDDWQEDLLRKAQEAFTADRVLEAIGSWEKVLEINPKQPDAPGYIESARKRLTELLEGHLARGDVAYKSRDLLTASVEWNAALALDPGSEDIQKRLKNVTGAKRVEGLRKQAAAAFKVRDYATAMARVADALALAPKDPGTLKLRAQIQTALKSGTKTVVARIKEYLKKNRLKDAKAEVDAARQSAPGDKDIVALMQTVNKRIEDAIAQYRDAAAAAMTKGDKDGARKAYESILSLNANDKDALDGYKKVAGGQQASVAVSGEKIKQLNRQGIFAYMNNDLAGAKRAWEEALKLDKGNAEIIRSLDRVNAKLKTQGAG